MLSGVLDTLNVRKILVSIRFPEMGKRRLEPGKLGRVAPVEKAPRVWSHPRSSEFQKYP